MEYESFKQKFDGGYARWHEAAYRALAVRTDDHLGWLELKDSELKDAVYSVRERSFFKKAFPVEKLDSGTRFAKMAMQWGAILAFDHSSTAESFSSEYDWAMVPLHSSLNVRVRELTDNCQKTFQTLVCEIAFTYADQVETDWQNFKIAFDRIS